MTLLPNPRPDDAAEWVGVHLGHLIAEPEVTPSARFRGTQAAADAALAGLDIAGYARQRNEVLPESRRGATALSPYIRHGLLSLPQVSAAVADAPSKDRQKFRDELMWQEYARHVYARVGTRNARALRFEPAGDHDGSDPWDRSMACMDATVGELERDGWLVNQTRMWLASQWTVRHGADWREGEDRFFAHLLDGSRAANRLGWQWTIGAGTGKPYGFSRWQVEKRAPELCAGCARSGDCPIEDWPAERTPVAVDDEPRLDGDPDPATTAGPVDAVTTGDADVVWLTAESLGDDDPALAAHPDLPTGVRVRRGAARTTAALVEAAHLPHRTSRGTGRRSARSSCISGIRPSCSPIGHSPPRSPRCPKRTSCVRNSTLSTCIRGRGCAGPAVARSAASRHGVGATDRAHCADGSTVRGDLAAR